MNINNKSVGFAVGVLNPSNNKEVLKKRPQNNSGYISEYMKHNNPSTKDCVKKLRSEFMKDLWKDAEYKELHSGENHYMKQSHKRKQFSENNPMHRKEVVDKIKNRVMEAVKTGTHNSKILLECPHCNKSCSIPNAKRWHFNKCKMVKIK
jgi:hypothetical protein